ncbi:MAG: hypothetical protein JW791_01825 [Nanoarchaeota archaeon]|nr:hypothetical protein [Nanoarchaeota archaeon]
MNMLELSRNRFEEIKEGLLKNQYPYKKGVKILGKEYNIISATVTDSREGFGKDVSKWDTFVALYKNELNNIKLGDLLEENPYIIGTIQRLRDSELNTYHATIMLVVDDEFKVVYAFNPLLNCLENGILMRKTLNYFIKHDEKAFEVNNFQEHNLMDFFKDKMRKIIIDGREYFELVIERRNSINTSEHYKSFFKSSKGLEDELKLVLENFNAKMYNPYKEERFKLVKKEDFENKYSEYVKTLKGLKEDFENFSKTELETTKNEIKKQMLDSLEDDMCGNEPNAAVFVVKKKIIRERLSQLLNNYIIKDKKLLFEGSRNNLSEEAEGLTEQLTVLYEKVSKPLFEELENSVINNFINHKIKRFGKSYTVEFLLLNSESMKIVGALNSAFVNSKTGLFLSDEEIIKKHLE